MSFLVLMNCYRHLAKLWAALLIITLVIKMKWKVFRQFWPQYKSSRPEVFGKKGVLKNVTKVTEKYLCLSLFFSKVADSFFYRTPLLALLTILWSFTGFYLRFNSPKVERDFISSKINAIYELPHEFPINLRHWKLGNIKRISNLVPDTA